MMRPEEDRYCEYLAYLYETAKRKYDGDIDELVSEAIYAFWRYEKSGRTIGHPKGLLDAILKHKHSDMLREKYKKSTLSLEETLVGDEPFDAFSQDDAGEEYASVRREVGRLLKIYRDVVVRYYMHNQPIDQIARELGIPKGTVLSRLSSARAMIKEGLLKMEKYAEISYEPKEATLGIYGGSGMNNEPFSLLSTPVEPNVLICAYERPVSLRGLADTLGMPTAYIEPIVEKLVRGELLGQTSSGLVYTRCFVENYEDSFGDVAFAEGLAEKNVHAFSKMMERAAAGYEACPSFRRMNEKQKATLILYHAFVQLGAAVGSFRKPPRVSPNELPMRPNGGRWLATLTVFDRKRKRDHRYDCSGPLTVNYRSPEKPSARCAVNDTQTPFGDAHWAYPGIGTYSIGSILRFYASFLPTGIKTDRADLYEKIPEFEKLHILRKNEEGKAVLDLPALTFAENEKYAVPIAAALRKECIDTFGRDLLALCEHAKCRVPAHVDFAKYFYHSGVSSVYTIAQMRACVEKGLFPYPVEIGKTPLILMLYEEEP